ncbi:MAG: HWE histidine kinase domain-containing protein [Pseudomonadota bacterium]
MNFANRVSDLTECDREPIHEIGSVQSFGGLIAISDDWVITHNSDNCRALLELNADPLLGERLSDYVLPEALKRLQQTAQSIQDDNPVEHAFGLQLRDDLPPFDCTLHAVETGLILEFEPHSGDSFESHLATAGSMLARLSNVSDVGELCTKAARVVRQALGYDRVMIYRFRRDDSGEVIAEDKREELEPYLGLRYPREDIPAQARELFKRNRIRVIANIESKQSPVLSHEAEPLNLSMSIMRSSAPVHLEYLRNMGVAASLTIAIVRQDRLWGLISCHHDSAFLPPRSLRTVAEMYSQVFSLMLDRILIEQSERLRIEARQLHDKLLQSFAGDATLIHDISLIEENLGEIIPHDGVSVWMGGKYRARGSAPSLEQFRALTGDLSAAPTDMVLASDALQEVIPAAADFADVVAGALVLPISRSPREFLVLWREPLNQTVRWGGNPAKNFIPGTDRLEPRSSFAAWAETVEGASEPWSDDELAIAEGLRVTLLEVVLRMSDEIMRERSRAQEQQDLLIAELNHRVRNILNLIRSLVAQSKDEALSVENFSQIIGGRIAALANAHDNITRQNWSPAPLASLFDTELAAYVSEKPGRFRILGDEVQVKPEAYTVIALVVHELVTNSVKYGALSGNDGRIDVTVAANEDSDLTISWREVGGPPVQSPTRRGFGSTIIERSIPYELKGKADLRFKLTGLEGDFVIPSKYVQFGAEAVSETAQMDDLAVGLGQAEPGEAERRALRPDHVLVLEDNIIIALDAEECLKSLGVDRVDIEGQSNGALSAIANDPPDFAIIDFNLGNESSLPVIEELNRRSIPFVLATGYSQMNEQIEKLGALGIMRKPYGRDEIAEALELTVAA